MQPPYNNTGTTNEQEGPRGLQLGKNRGNDRCNICKVFSIFFHRHEKYGRFDLHTQTMVLRFYGLLPVDGVKEIRLVVYVLHGNGRVQWGPAFSAGVP